MIINLSLIMFVSTVIVEMKMMKMVMMMMRTKMMIRRRRMRIMNENGTDGETLCNYIIRFIKAIGAD